jgi:hypothetical protein
MPRLLLNLAGFDHFSAELNPLIHASTCLLPAYSPHA